MALTPVPPTLSVGMVLFPNLTQLDLTGPYEVFARLPGTKVYLVAASLTPVQSERGLTISPDATFESVPHLDIICVPGGPGVDAMMENEVLAAVLAGAGATRAVRDATRVGAQSRRRAIAERAAARLGMAGRGASQETG